MRFKASLKRKIASFNCWSFMVSVAPGQMFVKTVLNNLNIFQRLSIKVCIIQI